MDALAASPPALLAGFLAGLVVAGSLLGWRLLAAHRRRELAEREAAVLAERLREREQESQERDALLERADERLRASFESVGAQALQRNNEQFLQLARLSFERLLSESRGDAEQRTRAVEELVKPIREALEKQQSVLRELELKRERAHAGVEEQLKQVAAAHERLGAETRRLETALRRSDTRGRWGEVQLRNCIELAGMLDRVDFHEQRTAGDTRLRPDVTVRLPGGGAIAVDAKVPLEKYLDSLAEGADREACLAAHAAAVEGHVKALADRRYWEALDPGPELVVLFITPESALLAALERRPDLHEKALEKRVLLATPTLLVGLLRSVAHGWQQEALARHARDIAETGRELHARLATFASHLGEVGKQLERGVGAYNRAVGSLERKVLPAARRLKELEAVRGEDVPEPGRVSTEARRIAAPELQAPSETEGA